jgi:hypothetical protein
MVFGEKQSSESCFFRFSFARSKLRKGAEHRRRGRALPRWDTPHCVSRATEYQYGESRPIQDHGPPTNTAEIGSMSAANIQ